MSDRTILVTGGAGFVGARFVAHRLAARSSERIVVLDSLTYAGSLARIPAEVLGSDRFEFVHGTIRNATLVASLVERADAVVHLAAETHVPRSINDQVTFLETDVLGTQTLAEQAVLRRGRLERFVHVSSSEVYGSARRVPMDEEHPLEPTTPYAAAKCGADRLVHSFVCTYGLPAVIVRPFNTYGPGQHLEKLVPRLLTHALDGHPLTVHGNGTAARDWVYVEDLCEALSAMLDAPLSRVGGEVFNVATGIATSVAEVARIVGEVTGGAEIVFTEDRPGQVQLHHGDATKLHRTLGCRPSTPLAEGLRRTARWYADNRAWWEPQRWMRAVTVAYGDGSLHRW